MERKNNMIIPHPESNLELNLLVLGAQVIKLLRSKNEFFLIEEVMSKFLKEDERRTPDMLINTLCFLYLLDLIEEDDFKVRLRRPYTPKLF